MAVVEPSVADSARSSRKSPLDQVQGPLHRALTAAAAWEGNLSLCSPSVSHFGQS